MVALNRAVAVAKIHGPAEGLRTLAALRGRGTLEHYHLLHAVEGQLWLDAGDGVKATASFRRAHELATIKAERELLARRLAAAEIRSGEALRSRAPARENPTGTTAPAS